MSNIREHMLVQSKSLEKPYCFLTHCECARKRRNVPFSFKDNVLDAQAGQVRGQKGSGRTTATDDDVCRFPGLSIW